MAGRIVLASENASPIQNPAAAIQETSPGIYQIGKIRLNRKATSVEFPVEINPVEGLLEYVLVTPDGSTHESLLRTHVSPSDLHAAMLLLGVRPAFVNPSPDTGTSETRGGSSPGRLTKDTLKATPKLSGVRVSLTLAWTDEGRERSAPLEAWILNTETGKPMSPGPWLYNGSLMVGTTFAAQADGNLIALVNDPGALVNNPRAGNDNDQIWSVNSGNLPSLEKVAGLTLKIAINSEPPLPRKE